VLTVNFSKPQLSSVLTGVLSLLKRHEESRAGLAPKRGDWRLPAGFADGLGALSADMLNQIRVARDAYALQFEARDAQPLIERLHERFRELRASVGDARAAPAIRQAAREEWAALGGATAEIERALVEHFPAGRVKALRGALKRWQREREVPSAPAERKAKPGAGAPAKKNKSKAKPKPKKKRK
jgi:hypothetical protein